MQATRKLVLHLLACVISLVQFTNAGNTEEAISSAQANHTRRYNPISEFRTRMLQVINMFPVSRQCTILTAMLEGSGVSQSFLMKEFVDTVLHQQLPCIPSTLPSESAVNTSRLRRGIDDYVTRLFNDFPLAFQCKIISDVTSTRREEPTRQPDQEDLARTISELRTKFNLIHMTRSCVDANPRGTITNTRVQIGVRLRKTMPLDEWLGRFKKILPNVYLSYVSKSGRISEFVSTWKRNENGAKIPVLPVDQFLVRLKDDPIADGSVAMVTFSLYSRTTSGDYKLINADEITASFEHISKSTLHGYLQAEVIGWRAHGERDSGHNPRLRNRHNKPSTFETIRLRASFPKYLQKFFKSLSGDGRCYVLRQISSYVERDLLAVEKRYHSLGILPKKYYCSRASKYGSKSKRPKPRLTSIWDRLDEFVTTLSKPTRSFIMATTVMPARNSTVIRETRPFNSMEIVMFALLGFLCLLIMVFVANCVVFTFKTKQLRSQCVDDFQPPQVVLRDTDGGSKSFGNKPGELPPEKLRLTVNPPFPFNDGQKFRDHSEYDRGSSAFSGVASGQHSAGNHDWRLLSMTSEGNVTVCDVISDEELERVSTV